jgi:hypothetical protein
MAFLIRRQPWVRLATVIVVCLLGAAAARAQSPAVSIEENVKAVFLYNFAKYVTWPAVTLGERSPAEVRICVTANDGFFRLLRGAVQGETIDGKPLVPVALDGLDEARTCQILYVRDTQTADAKAWLGAVRGAQVLTVGDGALTDETVITFVRDQNRLRFDVNRAAGSRRGLNVSSKLLRLARQVRER